MCKTTDIYDHFNKKRKLLKKWEEEKLVLVSEYCKNDIIATEAAWKSIQDNFTTREK